MDRFHGSLVDPLGCARLTSNGSGLLALHDRSSIAKNGGTDAGRQHSEEPTRRRIVDKCALTLIEGLTPLLRGGILRLSLWRG